jgi:hypothetical protein
MKQIRTSDSVRASGRSVAECTVQGGVDTMSLSTLVVIAVAAAVVMLAYRLLGTWMRFRGARVITCPENKRPAGVHVDARHAMATALGTAPQLRLSECSRWPEKQNCGQECLREIGNAPGDCLVRNILTAWYAGKDCALCGKPIGGIGAVEAKPALLCGDVTVEWGGIEPEKLHDILAGAKPVCFGCHSATSFARQHPELVIDRSRPA